MNLSNAMRVLFSAFLLASGTALTAQTVTVQSTAITREEDLLAESREAGLLTDWHLEGRFGSGRAGDFSRKFAPEKAAPKAPMRVDETQRYELVFPKGRFVLPTAMASRRGVFYATSSTYLSDSGYWDVYLESGAQAVVFVDGKNVLENEPDAKGVIRVTIRAERGYHSVLVKFTAQAAPFRVAILAQNSGSRRKNNTPYLQASPTSEDMTAEKINTVSKGDG